MSLPKLSSSRLHAGYEHGIRLSGPSSLLPSLHVRDSGGRSFVCANSARTMGQVGMASKRSGRKPQGPGARSGSNEAKAHLPKTISELAQHRLSMVKEPRAFHVCHAGVFGSLAKAVASFALPAPSRLDRQALSTHSFPRLSILLVQLHSLPVKALWTQRNVRGPGELFEPHDSRHLPVTTTTTLSGRQGKAKAADNMNDLFEPAPPSGLSGGSVLG
jgi:hypothetical protein